MGVYRNQTPTMTQIMLLSQMRITTVQEAVAFLRAMRPINDQIAGVLQRVSLQQISQVNHQQAAAAAPQPVEEPTPVEPEKKFVPEDLSTDEGYSDKEVEDKVEKLKSAKSKTQNRKDKEA